MTSEPGKGSTVTCRARIIFLGPATYVSHESEQPIAFTWRLDVPLPGGQAVGKSVLMPANPDLANKPEVIKALRQIVRGFAKPS